MGKRAEEKKGQYEVNMRIKICFQGNKVRKKREKEETQKEIER